MAQDNESQGHDAEWVDALRREDPEAQQQLMAFVTRVCQSYLYDNPELDHEQCALDTVFVVLQKYVYPKVRIQSLQHLVYDIAEKRCRHEMRSYLRRGGGAVHGPQELIDQLVELYAGTGMYNPVKVTFEIIEECAETILLNQRDKQIYQWYKMGYGPDWIAGTLGPPANDNNIAKRWYDIRAKLRGCHDKAINTGSRR